MSLAICHLCNEEVRLGRSISIALRSRLRRRGLPQMRRLSNKRVIRISIEPSNVQLLHLYTLDHTHLHLINTATTIRSPGNNSHSHPANLAPPRPTSTVAGHATRYSHTPHKTYAEAASSRTGSSSVRPRPCAQQGPAAAGTERDTRS